MNDRLEILKKKMHVQWGELAERLGISRSMLDQVRKGQRTFGPKTIRKVCELEVVTGISKTKSVSFLEEGPKEERLCVRETSAGYCSLSLEQVSELEAHNANIEERLAVVEKKLDRVLGMLERKEMK